DTGGSTMVAEPVEHERDQMPRRRRSAQALADIVEIGRAVAESATFADALTVLVDGAAAACGADVVVARVRRADRALVARAVAGPAALVADLEGTRLDADALPPDDVAALDALPPPVAAAARRAGATAVLLIPVRSDGVAVATLELFRSGARFDNEERLAA